jgi:tetratricopeptide (TPR) repeat protein
LVYIWYAQPSSIFEKALEIRQKFLPENHTHFVYFFNEIGMVYNAMGEHSKALPLLEKALQIKQMSVPSYHSDLGICYSNIGLVCSNLRNYSKALSSYEQAFDIFEKNYEPNHPNCQSVRNNLIGIRKIIRDNS